MSEQLFYLQDSRGYVGNAKPRKEQPANCTVCGAFMSANQQYVSGCPKCGADNRP